MPTITVNSGGGADYTDLSTALAAEDGDLSSIGQITFQVQNAFDEGSQIDLLAANFTNASASNYVRVEGPAHNGKPLTGGFSGYTINNPSGGGAVVDIDLPHTEFVNVGVRKSGGGSVTNAIRLNMTNGTGGVKIVNCVTERDSVGSNRFSINMGATLLGDPDCFVIGCLIISAGDGVAGGEMMHFLGNTIVSTNGTNTGISNNNPNDNPTWENNVVVNFATDVDPNNSGGGSATLGSQINATSDSSGSVTGVVLTDGVDFTEPSTGDYSLVSSGKMDGAGADLTATYTTDILGNTYPDPMDIGAFALVGGGGTTVEPDEVSLGLTIGEPAITQQYAIQPDGVSLSMTVDSPAITQQHTVPPDDVALPLSVGTTSLTQVHVIAPAEVLLALGIESPTITQAGSVAPDPVELGLTVDSPTIVQAHNVSPDDVSLPMSIDDAMVQVAGSISPDPVSLALLLDTLTIVQQHTIPPDDVDLSLLVDSTAVTSSGITIAPVDVDLALSVDSSVVTQYHVITPDDITLQLLIDTVSLGGLVIGELEGTIYVYAALDGSVEAFPALSGTIH